MSAEFQQPAHSTRIIEPLTAAITANRSSHLVTNLSAEEPGSMGTPPPSRISSPEEASQNVVQPPNKASGGDMSLNEPGPWIPIPIGGAPTFSRLENLLRISAEGRRPFLPETDYTPFTAHSPVHLGIDQATPAWIITHLGIIGEEKPSDKTKLALDRSSAFMMSVLLSTIWASRVLGCLVLYKALYVVRPVFTSSLWRFIS
jgi:hypothetical protein